MLPGKRNDREFEVVRKLSHRDDSSTTRFASRPLPVRMCGISGRQKLREPQIILKTDQRTLLLELGLGGKFQAKSSGWDENRIFLEGDVLEVEYAMAAGC